MWKRHGPIILILLLALALRLFALTELPPGLTHDEANHGREAIGVLDGIFLFYFPLNYGSEPLYSYTVAGSMALLGENLFALRLVNVLFGVATVAITYAWVYRAFDRRTALLTAVLLAISFWPIASSRQALRAGMLPFFVTAAIYFFWQIFTTHQSQNTHYALRTTHHRLPITAFALSLAITFHIYLAARVAWLLFPLFLVYLLLFHRPLFRRVWPPTLAGLLLTAVLITPLFLYLQRYPYALTRLEMLDRPLQALWAGDPQPLLQNAAGALLAFVWPGQGDQFLAYNLPGRPVLVGVTAVFFITGILICLWRWRRPNAAFLLLWFGVGILPSLITGATANTTRNLAALPAVYALAAVGFWALADWLKARQLKYGRWLVSVGLVIWLVVVGSTAASDYFLRWGQSPEVRGAYQQNLVAALAYLKTVDDGRPVVLSTVYPGPAHDPSIGLVLGGTAERRWVDGRYALIIPPQENALVIVPNATPLHPAFVDLLRPLQTISTRPNDLDPAFTVYEWATEELAWEWDTAANLNNAVTLRHAEWLNNPVQPGETAELLTIWQVQEPTRVGPIVPPAFTTDATMFTQILAKDGRPLAQRDSLEAPSWDWQPGDIILQIHPILIPADTSPGSYPAIVGIYDRTSGVRLPLLDELGTAVDDKITVPLLEVRSEK
jgi:4-amino-4-deoxy-L-arabinose transferase-like glycosyltransferase